VHVNEDVIFRVRNHAKRASAHLFAFHLVPSLPLALRDWTTVLPRRTTGLLAQLSYIHLAILIVFTVALSQPMRGQSAPQTDRQNGSIVGTVSDASGQTVGGTNVVLEGPNPNDRRTVATNENGFFEFHDVKPGNAYHVRVSLQGFTEWSSSDLSIEPNQYKILTGIQLQLARIQTSVNVTPTVEEIATEQVKAEGQQRVFGVIPNFNVVYDSNPVPLTTRLKFKLALKGGIDPVTFIGIGIRSGVQQAGNTPDYGRGANGFAKRFGANTADAFTGVMIGGALLPSLLHQDPRYFYQGTGTTRSRIRHAVLHPFVCKGDNGLWQPNYSSLGGDLASAAISNAYYPESNRGAGQLFKNFGIGTAQNIAGSLIQEFVLHKWTHKSSPSN
jgi:hypothetical protein